MQLELIKERLLSKKINPTPMRMLILDLLLNSSIALSLSDIDNALDKADRITIYRTLKKFEEKGVVHTIEDGTGSLKYALCESDCTCAPEFTHAHFHCNVCNRTYCLRNIRIPDITLPKNFITEQSSVMLKGICDHCKA